MSIRYLRYVAAVIAAWALAGAALAGVETSVPAGAGTVASGKTADGESGPSPTAQGKNSGMVWVAAPGRVEPVSEEMRLGFDIAGKITDVLVEEGDAVRRDQVLAKLWDADLRAAVAAAEAALAAREAELEKILAGARSMERKEAQAALAEATTVMRQAKIEHERRERLLAGEVLAPEEADRAEREYLVSRQRVEAARQRFHLVDDPSRSEDIKRAWAQADEARASLDRAKAYAAKAEIRSPIDGVVLRKHRRAGEMVSVSFDTPVVTVGDISRIRARADVDEKDIAKVREGQRAYLVADAYGERKFWGTVFRVAKILGRKNVRTDDPAEKNDTRILEALIDLDEPGLPVGLRMDVFVIVEGGPDGKNGTLSDGRQAP
ncbi:HlyD family secretion protein [Desulfolutivibrio sulfoxidireducens]|uniref:HlyD family secretion protein n=1 Tax=Desulfolutivibrio sulfoxidireducens TaxID=2773299 RepID=UPI00159DE2CD|nr:efflux RND transporter periplasmic adaptor subunit [Desulfolutivibrio sulfoxidireducens]QLA21030.1 HlyD family efflux transporter periplasmic adaptor subunit [Desulfolutivibrio sulfoxidireducens]